jgi:hypothetical protein
MNDIFKLSITFIARQYPRQVSHIYIRNVTENRNYQQIFQGLPKSLWTVFEKPPRK